ncbi:MAG: Holliday junction DNA helicase RuvA, holliday junction DNA helicase RuvA [Microgenomates group bacterium GW2011_GWC1_49_7]|nr:MAG: Holliday junction DNA helicase RuvA, holliday junction DNA helicase RuvA [Microgenomates group bacterium GW2011_GWC1_49_7]
MIGRLSGTIDVNTTNPLIIDVHGVGYLVHVPERFLASIKVGKSHTLCIHSHIREDEFDLYGFANQQELALFELLLTVSGVGPKTALAVVDRGVSAVETAVRKSDVDFFTTVPRLGTKNAQKIIIELKSRLGSTKMLNLEGESGDTRQVMEALSSMGFDRHEIRDAIKKFDAKDISVEQKIRHALKLLGS